MQHPDAITRTSNTYNLRSLKRPDRWWVNRVHSREGADFFSDLHNEIS